MTTRETAGSAARDYARTSRSFDIARRMVRPNTHTCALITQGAVACWGARADGELDVPSGRFRKIATGCQSACTLDDARQVRCWGGKGSPFTPRF